MDNDIEIKAADTLLERGVRVKIGRRRSIVIRQPSIGALIAVSREYLKMNFTDQYVEEVLSGGSIAEAHRLLQAHGMSCARIAAVGWLHGRWRIRLLSGIAARWLLWRMSPQKLLQVRQWRVCGQHCTAKI